MTEQNIHLLWDEEIDALVLKSVLAVLDNMEAYQAHQGGQADLSETLELFRNHLLMGGLESIVSNDIRHTEIENQEELPLVVNDEEEYAAEDDIIAVEDVTIPVEDLDFDGLELDEDEALELDTDDAEGDEDLVEVDHWAVQQEKEEAEALEAERLAEEEAELLAREISEAEEEAYREDAERTEVAERAEEEKALRLAEEIAQAEEEAWIEYGVREDERIRQAEADALAAYEAELADRANRPSPRSILAHAKSLEEE